MKYQHKTPQRDGDHEVKPAPKNSAREKKLTCAGCGSPIKLVDDNEGPESIKALFRF